MLNVIKNFLKSIFSGLKRIDNALESYALDTGKHAATIKQIKEILVANGYVKHKNGLYYKNDGCIMLRCRFTKYYFRLESSVRRGPWRNIRSAKYEVIDFYYNSICTRTGPFEI